MEFDDVANRTPTESSAEIRKRVMAARVIQRERFKDLPGIHCNAQMSGKQFRMARRSRPPEAQGPHEQAQYVGYRALDRPSTFGVTF